MIGLIHRCLVEVSIKKRYFFVLGLPRSRTAWFSNFLTYGPSWCYHEELVKHANFESLKKKLDSRPEQIVGISDTLGILLYKELKEYFPEAKFILIKREVVEVEESAERLGLQSQDMLEIGGAALDAAIENFDEKRCLMVRFSRVNEMAPTAWKFITGTQADPERVEALNLLNVQIHDVMKMLRDVDKDRVNTLFETEHKGD